MNYDWNWFFSSFCQSAAALIGIIGAFIISRLLGLSEKINAVISDFDNLVIEYKKTYANIQKRHFWWYTKMNVRYDSDLKNAINNGEYEDMKREQILEKIYSVDISPYKIDNAVIEGFYESYEVNNPKYTEMQIGKRKVAMSVPGLNIDIAPDGIWNQLNEEKEKINKVEVEAKTLIQYFKQNLQDLKSFYNSTRPLKAIIILLMISFPLTVIYPLDFMPVISNQNPIITFNPIIIFESFFTLKFLLLSIFFLAIEGLLYYFYIMTKQIEKKLTKAIDDNSDNYRNIKSYSTYFYEN